MADDEELKIGGKLVVTETTGCCGFYCLGVMVFWQSVLITPVMPRRCEKIRESVVHLFFFA